MNQIIQVKNLSKKYGDFKAVDDISFNVMKGELFAFLGTNGAGKSTTINMICTLITKTSGEITVDGYDTSSDGEEVRKRLGIVFQDNVLDNLLTVKDNLTLRAAFLGLTGDELSTRISTIKSNLDLQNIWLREFGKLSGGQKRKCEIARAIMGSPEILILDEPTTGLDPKTRQSIWNLIRHMQASQGMTIFLTTHYMEEAAAADNVVILEKGIIKAEGTPDDLKSIYGKDSLKIRFKDDKQGQKQLKELALPINKKVDTYIVKVNDSNDALPILDSIRTNLKDFELIKGSMDDVFLAVTDHSEVQK